MAEHFCGENDVVHFSNGATEELFRAWCILAHDLPPGAATEQLQRYLQETLELSFYGGRAFSVHPPEERLAAPEVWSLLASLVAAFARALAQDEALLQRLEVAWDQDLRLSWLARIEALHQMMRAEGVSPLPELCLDIREGEQAPLERERLLRRASLLKRQREPDKQALLEITERLVAIFQRSETRRSYFEFWQYERLDLLLALGRNEDARGLIQEIMEWERDPEGRELLADYLATL